MLEMTRAEKSQFVATIISLAVYVAVAWIGAELFQVTAWRVLLALFAVRAFFALIETTASIVNWRLFGRRLAVRNLVEVLREYEFPPRVYAHDTVYAYLARIIDEPQFPKKLRRAAAKLEQAIESSENSGFLVRMRMHSAAEAALEEYSPKSAVPPSSAV